MRRRKKKLTNFGENIEKAKSRMNWSSRSNTALHWKHNLANDRTNMIFTLPSASLWPEKNEEKLSSFSLRTFYSVNFSLPLVLSFGSFCRPNDSARRNRKRAPNVWVWSKCEAHKRLSANNSMMQNRKKSKNADRREEKTSTRISFQRTNAKA